jgi:hypothetical protein
MRGRSDAAELMRNHYLWLATLILLVAAVLRLSQLAQYPPGPHFDEAANILITRSIAFDGANLFPIANSYQGRETLYHYLNVPMFRLVDDGVFGLRISSTFINLLTIASGIGLGRVMFPGKPGRVIGLAVGVMMAISFHQIFMSRQAYRAVTLPMMQGLGLLFLWRGLNARRHHWRWIALGGVLSGGAIYTYMASRLFPVWLVIAGLALLLLDRDKRRLRLRQGAAYFGVMLLVMLPMLVYARNNPDIFFQRLSEVSEGAVEVSLGESLVRHLKMFFIRGDFGNLRYNIPGRPYFTPIEGMFLLIGLGLALRRLFSRELDAVQRTAYVLLLLSPLMIIPSVISVAGFPPSHMRSLGIVPLIFLLAAVGFEAVWRWWMAHVRRWDEARLLRAVVMLALLAGSAAVYSSYISWAGRTDLFEQADGDLALAAAWLDEQVDPGTRVYVASYHREHPTVITGWDGAVTWLGSDSLILPPDGQPGVVIFSRSVSPHDWEWVLQGAELLDVPPGPDGQPAFLAYRLDGIGVPATGIDVPVRNELLEFQGLQAKVTASGETALVTMAWKVLNTIPYYRLRPVVHLEDAGGDVLASSDVFLLGTSSWQPGELIFQQVQLDVPVALPPRDYALKVAWVDRDSDRYVTYQDADGAYAGTIAEIGTVTVVHPDQFPPPEILSIDHCANEMPANGVVLLGWNTLPQQVRPGEVIAPLMFWRAAALQAGQERRSLRLQVVLQGEDERRIWEGNLPYGPEKWLDDELVRTRLNWRVPRDTAAGIYSLVLRAENHEIPLGEVVVGGEPRLYDPPPVDQVLDYRLGNSLGLYGYSIRMETGLTLELVWTAHEPVDVDYTVFVHVLNADDVTIAQHDQMPRNYTYRTSLWDTGEYIIDRYQFDLDPEQAESVRLGLYVQATGERLTVYSDANETLSDSIFFMIRSY